MSSPESPEINPHKQFMDSTYEAAQLQMDLAERAIGMDAMWADRDAAENDEPPVGAFSQETALAEVIAGDLELKGFTHVGLAPGSIDFICYKEADDGSRIIKILAVATSAAGTQITQQNRHRDKDFRIINKDDVEPEVTLEEVNNYLKKLIENAKALKELSVEELQSKIKAQLPQY